MRSVLGFLFFFFILLYFSCSTTKSSPLDIEEAKTFFGAGGGFTGAVNEYCLMSNGDLYKKVAYSEEWIMRKTEDRKLKQQCLRIIESLKLSSISFNEPGNRYKFIRSEEGYHSHQITWGSENMPPPKEIEILYIMLNKLTIENE